MTAIPHRREPGVADVPLPAALAMPPAIAPALAARTVRVPISLLHEVVHDMATALASHRGGGVVVFSQDYGVAHRGAATLLHQLLQARDIPRLVHVAVAADTTWRAATRDPGALVIASAGPADLSAGAPVTRHASVIIDITPDPNTWTPRHWPADAERPPSRSFRAAEWLRHPVVSRQRGDVRRRVAEKLRGLIGR